MRTRGYSLPFVIMILLMLSVVLASLFFVLAAGAKSTESMLGRRRLFYACDGISRIVSTSAQNYFGQTQAPSAADLRDFVCTEGGGCSCAKGGGCSGLPTFVSQTPGLAITDFDVPRIGNRSIAPLDSGPFEGMIAMQDVVEMRVSGVKPGTSWRCDVRQEVSLAKVGLFQFAVFSGIPMDLFSPPTMDIRGPVHINGNFCAGGGNFSLTIEKLTVSGQLRSGCHGGSISVVPNTNVGTNGFNIRDRIGGTPKSITSANDGATAGWKANALARWHGNALDQSHDVPALRLPVAAEAAVQPGNNQDGAALTNLQTLRLVVDPPRSDDSPSAIAERLYNKADIRIINGVWYRRDGTVLWSDHTGVVTFAEHGELGVPSAIPSPPSAPKRYSYYERNGAGAVSNDFSKQSVVSYGLLHKVGANNWKPGVVSGTGTAQATNDAQLVEGTLSGFVDRRVALAPGNSHVQGRILPLNFDVTAFIAALQDTSPGELGAVFSGGSFNGIIWIGNTWPGHNAGSTTNPASNTFASSAPPSSLDPSKRHTAPPLPLCGGNIVLAGTISPPACNDADTPRVNAVRVHNASVVDPGVLPRGLTIATNGPMYVLGDVNTSSLVSGPSGPVPGTPRMIDPAGTWVPMLLAGDAVTLLSTNWQDQVGDRAFGVASVQITGCNLGANPASASATETTIVSAILAGHVETGATWGGGINNFPRFLECWTGVNNRIIGSMVIGFRSVYQRSRYHLFAYRPPNRLWSFDTNFANPAQQPPGTPLFDVQATRRWKR